ncbi:MAG: hypothetical protein JOZ15_20215 [Acidobacteria bacterium]|nr:hypothetical protein [Acidobacteriota bacterium]
MRTSTKTPAAEVLDGLLEDWRRFRGPGAPEDDTTIVVLRNRAGKLEQSDTKENIQ